MKCSNVQIVMPILMLKIAKEIMKDIFVISFGIQKTLLNIHSSHLIGEYIVIFLQKVHIIYLSSYMYFSFCKIRLCFFNTRWSTKTRLKKEFHSTTTSSNKLAWCNNHAQKFSFPSHPMRTLGKLLAKNLEKNDKNFT